MTFAPRVDSAQRPLDGLRQATPSPISLWPNNAWYVACRPQDLVDGPLGRTICGHDVVLFRGDGGRVAAVEDFCPHRGAPLSLGRVVDERLVCGYHGLQMGCDGRPRRMVGQPDERVRKVPSIRTYPVVERYGFVWLWPGATEQAMESLIPDLFWADNPDWAYDGGLYHVGCDYRLMIDNLMDLTHETYVHASSIGQKEIEEAPVLTRVIGNEVVTSRLLQNVMAPPFWRDNLRLGGLADDVMVDRWQICRFSLPSHVMIEVGVAHHGQGGYDAPPNHKVGSIVVDFITPETETSIWYFWGMARNFRPNDRSLTERIRDGQGKIFSEDRAMLELQQKNIARWPDRPLLRLNIDSGGVHARRLIDHAIRAETALAAVGDAP